MLGSHRQDPTLCWLSARQFGWLLVLRFWRVWQALGCWYLSVRLAINWLKSTGSQRWLDLYGGYPVSPYRIDLYYFIIQSVTVNAAVQSSLESIIESIMAVSRRDCAARHSRFVTFVGENQLAVCHNSRCQSQALAKPPTNPTSSIPACQAKISECINRLWFIWVGYILPATFATNRQAMVIRSKLFADLAVFGLAAFCRWCCRRITTPL